MPDSDAPTPREATLREALDAVDAALRAMPGKKYGNRVAVDTVNRWEAMRVVAAALRLQAAASTAAAGEGATGDVDAAWEALREAIRWHRGSLGDADPLIEHRPLIEAALRSSRATSETPRETPLAGPLDVAKVLAVYHEMRHTPGRASSELVKEWADRLAAAARGSE